MTSYKRNTEILSEISIARFERRKMRPAMPKRLLQRTVSTRHPSKSSKPISTAARFAGTNNADQLAQQTKTIEDLEAQLEEQQQALSRAAEDRDALSAQIVKLEKKISELEGKHGRT